MCLLAIQGVEYNRHQQAAWILEGIGEYGQQGSKPAFTQELPDGHPGGHRGRSGIQCHRQQAVQAQYRAIPQVPRGLHIYSSRRSSHRHIALLPAPTEAYRVTAATKKPRLILRTRLLAWSLLYIRYMIDQIRRSGRGAKHEGADDRRPPGRRLR